MASKKKNISVNQLVRGKINDIVDQMRVPGNENHLVIQIMDYRGDDLHGYLIAKNPGKIAEINGMMANKEFVNSLETLKNIR